MLTENQNTPGSGTATGLSVATGSARATHAVEIDLPDIGSGTQRTSGTYIALLLQLENDRQLQAEIIADVCDIIGLPLEKVIAYRDWLAAGGWTQSHTTDDVPPPAL